jgi:tetratricopeptide (TPR) repeat protein
MRFVILCCLACLWAVEPPADLGGQAPALPVGSSAPPLVVLCVEPEDDATPALPAGLAVVRLSEAAQVERWLGPDPALPAAALVGGDGRLLWRVNLRGLPGAWERERSGGFDRALLAEVAALRVRLRAALQAEADETSLPRALELTGEILAREPVDDEALRLRLDLAKHLDRREVFRDTLQRLPLAALSAELANELAWARVTDEDLAWRNPDLALRLSEHARELTPEDPVVQDTYARVRYALGDLEGAVAAQIKAVSLDPEDTALSGALDYYREVLALRDARR